MPEYNLGVKFGATGLETLGKGVEGAARSFESLKRSLSNFPAPPFAPLTKSIGDLTGAFLTFPAAAKSGLDISQYARAPLGDIANLRAAVAELKTDLSIRAKINLDAQSSILNINAFKKSVIDLKAMVSSGIKPVVSLTSLDQLQAKLNDITAKLRSNTDPVLFTKLRAEAAKTQAAISALDKSVGASGKGLSGLAPGASQAGQALTNLGRVAQDAPFGFIGIQNNIGPLIDSFGYLSNATKSAGGPLKALTGALVGPAGIGLGIAVVTGLITAAVQKYGSLGNALDVVFGLTTDLEQANRTLAKSFAESEASVAGEVANINSLLGIANNKALSDAARSQALQKLNKDYDEYLPKLTLETVGTDATKAAVDKLTASLVRQAKVRGLQDLITKSTQKQTEALVQSSSEYAGTLATIQAALGSLLSTSSYDFSINLNTKGAIERGEDVKKLRVETDIYTAALNKLNTEEAQNNTLVPTEKDKPIKKAIDLLGQQISALERIRKVQQEIVDIPTIDKKIASIDTTGLTQAEVDELTGKKKIEQALKDVDTLIQTSEKIYRLKNLKITSDFKKGVIDSGTAADLRKQAQEDLDKVFTQQALVFEGTLRVKPTVVLERYDLLQSPEEINSGIAKATGLDKTVPLQASAIVEFQTVGFNRRQLIAAFERLKGDLSSTINGILTQATKDAFVGIGEGIGNALSGGGLKDLVSPLLNVIASALSELGKAVIAYGIAMLGLQTALKNTFNNPYVAIAVGVAAVAAGALLRNKAQKAQPKFANGGIADGPLSGYGVELHGREMIIPLDKLGGAPNYASKDGFGLLPSVNFSGDMFRIMLNKVDRRKKRA